MTDKPKIKTVFAEGEYGDYRTTLTVEHGGREILNEIDTGEPEDNTFGRDWKWVPLALQMMYDLGVIDGKKADDDKR